MKIINSKVHGIIDYVVVIFLWLSPTLFGLSELGSKLVYGLGFIHFTLTAITDFPMGLVKRLPIRLHGIVELVVSIALIALPFILSTNKVDAFFLDCLGLQC